MIIALILTYLARTGKLAAMKTLADQALEWLWRLFKGKLAVKGKA